MIIENTARRRCPHCETVKPLTEFRLNKSGRQVGQPRGYCKPCASKISKEYSHREGIYRPMEEAKDCSIYLGIYIVENALSRYFDHIKRMPNNTPGYDFICEKNYKIDVKSSCRRHVKNRANRWEFHTRHNKIADYFLCLAFDNRTSLQPEHIWLIPASEGGHRRSIVITDVSISLKRWGRFERSLEKAKSCCAAIKKDIIDVRQRPEINRAPVGGWGR